MIGSDADTATIAGGSNNLAAAAGATIGGGRNNAATNELGVIGGGEGNWIGSPEVLPGFLRWPGIHSVIAGGLSNRISRPYSAIAGGSNNVASTPGSAIGGGFGNRILSPDTPMWDAIGAANTIGGGEDNLIDESDIALQYSVGAAIGGGDDNYARCHAPTIGGGQSNRVTGSYATIPGGFQNTASGSYALAAGRRAEATHRGSFVWGDSTDADVASTAADQFSTRANGGVRLTVNAGSAKTVTWGDRYRDNAITAWGRVNATGGLDYDFNVTSVTRPNAGEYEITLATGAESSFRLVPVAIAEVDSPPTSAAATRLVTINQTAANQFTVYITDGDYNAVNNDFMFIVTGR